MDNWFASISAETELSSEAAHALRTDGFAVLPGPALGAAPAESARLYDEAVSGAPPDDIRVGSTTMRVRDFVNREADFDELYRIRRYFRHVVASSKSPSNSARCTHGH